MNKYLSLFVALVLGLIIGAWWPQSELSLAKSEIKALKEELASKTKKSLLPEMARMMTMPETMARRSTAPKNKPEPPVKTPTPAPDFQGMETIQDEVEDEVDGFEDELASEMSLAFENAGSADEALETMADLWQTRRDIARAALADNLGMSDAEMEAFDAAMNKMNDELEDRFTQLADTMATFEDMEPSPENAFRMAHDFTGVFVDAYDSMDDTLPYGWREDAGDTLDLTAFIDPYVFKPMLDLEGDWGP